MKQTISIVLLIFSTVLAFAQADSINQVDANGFKQGKWKKIHQTGKVRYIGNFKNDKPIGTFKYYDEFGKLTAELTHKGDSTKAIFFHVNGKILSTGKYYQQKKTGLWQFYDNNGFKSSDEFYENDVQSGIQTVYYSTGKIAKKFMMVKGLEQDTVCEYFESGELKFKGNFVDGNPDSSVFYYHPTGKIRILGRYKDAVKHGKWTYYDELGVITHWEFYRLGDLVKTIQRETGTPKKEEEE